MIKERQVGNVQNHPGADISIDIFSLDRAAASAGVIGIDVDENDVGERNGDANEPGEGR